MADSEPTPRKSSQEVEIDHLLAEEFHCDPKFSARFAKACGLQFEKFRVHETVAEPALDQGSYGDLLVKAEMDGRRTALLIEDKIDARPATRQAANYAAHAERLRHEGWDHVVTVLVAPGSYRGERYSYDATVELETISQFLDSPDSARTRIRREYRRTIIERALEKKAKSGVQNPDIALHRLHSDYLEWMNEQCRREGLQCQFPALREAYNQESWVDPIRNQTFPGHVRLRHRLWTDRTGRTGLIDLIIDSDLASNEVERLEALKPEWATVGKFGKKRTKGLPGTQISVKVPEMRQSKGFHEASAAEAFEAMKLLTAFFHEWSESNMCSGARGTDFDTSAHSADASYLSST